ncbi:MAG: phosphoribosylanthranilate isomerase [Candidatus Methanosuratus sp.]|nr:phosphoribosylanthranilate isomerase [Candidatus Methanosuratincola sp.]
MRVKVCGITRDEDIAVCVDAGVDALGFVVEYPLPVPWNISREEARRLVLKVPPYVSSVLVTSGRDVERAVALAREVMPDVIQLHGGEGEGETGEIVKLMRGEGVKVVKALPIDVSMRLKMEELTRSALSFQDRGIDALLLDSRTDDMPAGTGIPINMECAKRVREALRIPMILAGGLNPENVGEAIRHVRPYGVDVLSGVERSPGIKDPEKVRTVVKRCRSDME